MTINKKLAAFAIASGLAATLSFADNIDDKPRTLADWGVPNIQGKTPSLVADNLQNANFGEDTTTTKFYNVDKTVVGEYSSNGEVYRITVKRSPTSLEEVYIPKGENFVERIN